jgi:hypothetical protein
LASIPEETIRVAQAAFPHSTRLMQMRDHLGAIYDQSAFEALYPQWTWPDDTGHIWEALSPHLSYIPK